MSKSLAPYADIPVLVLGASGFLGRWTARALTRAGARVVAGARDPEQFAAGLHRWEIVADVRAFDALDPDRVSQLVETTRPAVVFNLVGYGVDRREEDERLLDHLNAAFPASLARVVAASTARDWPYQRLVHVGSALEYGLADGVLSESTTPRPHTSYGRSKLAGTTALADVGRLTGCPCVTARVFTAFGAGEHAGRLLPSLMAARDGRVVTLSVGSQSRDFVYAEDVAEGLLRLGISRARPGEAVNLATGSLASVGTFVRVAASLLGLSPGQLSFGAESIRSDEMRIAGVDMDRLRALTGWLPDADLESAVRRAIRFADHVDASSTGANPGVD